MRAAGKTISFDPNLRPALWPSRAAMVEGLNALADWVLPGIGEGEILTGYTQPEDIASFYLERGARGVIVKLGAAGAYFRTADGAAAMIAGQPVAKVVDTVGAGDGFAVGVISALLEGKPLREAVARGNRIGAPGDSGDRRFGRLAEPRRTRRAGARRSGKRRAGGLRRCKAAAPDHGGAHSSQQER
ncbi:MAG: 2-ketogluconate kinase (EC [uncultured Paraburkholderia sp.]|nr:MAG: 2-ketogluconate kinase (EC [uncultured Paraburkholderia sp.]